ncbi:MAG: tRNA pseudouridine(55) synthase TruB [Planctomycetota bacterium]|jgi:tRNA pseudouridine55 synthase
MPRKPKNNRPDLNGILVIDKPLGMTSAAVCRKVRHLTGGAKVGHAGTLDPLATGVLVLCLGTATKRIDAIMGTSKRYRTTIDLSAFSTTDDAEGERTPIYVDTPPTREQIEAALESFVGQIEQQPPVFSAVHVEGKRSYKTARKAEREGGLEEIDRPPAKHVTIHSIDILRYEWPELELAITSGKGVYIRSIARDLGELLETGGMLASLRRTAVGEYDESRALPLDQIPHPVTPGSLLASQA